MRTKKVRLAEARDLQEISRLFKVLDTENFHFSEITSLRTSVSEQHVFVVEKNPGNLGAAMVLKPEDGSCEIVLLASEIRGGGSDLVKFAENFALDMDIKRLWCWSLVRYQAKNFYQKIGFSDVFLMHNQWYGEDCYILGKNLQPNL